MTARTALARRAPATTAAVAALRPHQWTKNLLLFAALIFAGDLQDVARWPYALAGFAAFCLLSSAGYLVNDVRDAEVDRLHPTKRLRPVAHGDLSPRRALALAGVLAAGGLALAAPLGLETLALALAFAGGQLLYTTVLKRLVLADVLAIAALFVLRAAAGASAVDVHISNWLLFCTAMLAMFLAFAKRRAELLGVQGDAGRAVLRRYSEARLGLLVWATAGATLAAYAAYTLTGSDSKEMAATLPFVLFGLGRYVYLIRRRDLGEEPDRVLLTDLPVLVSVVAWALIAATALNAA